MSLTFHSSLINNFSDIIGGVNGTPANVTWKSTNRGLKPELNGADAKITYGDIGTIKTIALWVHLRSTTESILDLNGTQTIDIASGTVRGNIWTAPAVYVDGAATASLSNLTGYHQIIITTATGIAASAVVAGLISAAYGKLIVDDIRGYDNELSASEALALYNATSGEYGVRIAEFSHQHDPAAVIPAQTGEVLRIGGKLAGDAVDTISDRSGEGNDATIHGAMPADGFLAGGRRFVAANENYLDISDGKISESNVGTIEALIYVESLSDQRIVSYGGGGATSAGLFAFEIRQDGNWYMTVIQRSDGEATANIIRGSTPLSANTLYHVVLESSGTAWAIHINGIEDTLSITGGANNGNWFGDTTVSETDKTLIGALMFNGGMVGHVDGTVGVVCIYSRALTTSEIQSQYNALAVLPFWSINYRDYPDNVTTYTDRFPHSSSIIASGAFKIDDDKIQCASAGTLTYSASHEFDGQEYITVTIAGTEYSGTGTITQGNTTVSVAQGSNKITVAMGTGNTIDKIRIQFRATV